MITRFARTKTEGARSVEGGVGVKLSKFKSSNHGFWQFVIRSVNSKNVECENVKRELEARLFTFLLKNVKFDVFTLYVFTFDDF
jgi:hypothetical protein